MKRTIALAAAVLILGGCGGKAGDVGATALVTPSAAKDCTVGETEELYVAQMYDCTSKATKVYVFNTSTARDSWRKIAEEFGTVVLNQGDTWLEVKA